MRDFFVLFGYELKKILKNKVTIVALIGLTIVAALQGIQQVAADESSLSLDTYEYRSLPVFGHMLMPYQAAPILYLVVSVIAIVVGRTLYLSRART